MTYKLASLSGNDLKTVRPHYLSFPCFFAKNGLSAIVFISHWTTVSPSSFFHFWLIFPEISTIFYTFDFFFMYLLGNFFKKHHTHQRRTVHPLSLLSRTIPHIFHPTTDMERCHRRIAVLYSQRVRAAAHRMGIVSTLSRKNTSEENIPVGLCFPIVLRDYFRSFHLAISRWVLGGQSVLHTIIFGIFSLHSTLRTDSDRRKFLLQKLQRR